MANEKFGTLITANGGGYTWSGNSRENKLTSWSNDPINDRPSEILNLEYEDKKIELLPYESLEKFVVRFGFGYAEFEKQEDDIDSVVKIFVPLEETKKIYSIKLKNNKEEEKEFKIKYKVEVVLGVNREYTKKHIVINKKENAVIINNYYRENYAKENMYIVSNAGIEQVLEKDKILYIDIKSSLKPKEEKEIIIEMGTKIENDEIEITKNTSEELNKVKEYWQNLNSRIKIKTPVESMNIMMNGWLLYQTLSSRIMARTSFYQASGAFGFRDQLQDSLMFLYYNPELTKKQIIYHAKHQFIEGDVLHWWHPEKDNGIRTRYTDDLLWLPYVLAEYIEKEKDYSILKIEVPYVKMQNLAETEDEKYESVEKTKTEETIYMHAKRAIEKSLNFGENGLPKMGGGDWNDGMNKIKGESVWLGFFLYEVLKNFCKICEIENDNDIEKYIKIMETLKENLNKNAWDGNWYKRAYFEDGKAIGSIESEECKIDGISQSWAAISGAGEYEKTKTALESMENYLVDRENMIIKLLTPPFNKTNLEPGYIKSYIPGVRENGGQYTHGAVWSIIANAKYKNAERAGEYFRFLNPIEHARTKENAIKYKVEPYVVVADIYTTPNMIGRGGWTWYTGSSAWLFMAGFENILGIKKKGDILYINPCIPQEWESYYISYKYKETLYNINIYNPEHKSTGLKTIYNDNNFVSTNEIKMINDGETHSVDLIIG